MRTIYIHVGPHKTASTYLQQHIFNLLEGFDYYGPASDITKKDDVEAMPPVETKPKPIDYSRYRQSHVLTRAY